MPTLTANDTADLRAEFTDAQPDHSLVLRRPNDDGTKTTLPPQLVQVAYAQGVRLLIGGLAGTTQSLSAMVFYRESPFNVRVGDKFTYEGHVGTIRRVLPDPVLDVIAADAELDTGR
jgi:hypothetical protein